MEAPWTCGSQFICSVNSVSHEVLFIFHSIFLMGLNFFDSIEALAVQPRLVVVNLYVLQMINFHFWKLHLVPYRSID